MTPRSLLLLSLLSVSFAACKNDKAAPSDQAPPVAAGPGQIQIAVTEQGFEPDPVSVPKGTPVTLVFTRKTDNTCAKEVVLQIADQKIEKKLPLNQPVQVAATFPDAGKLTYACGMDMIHATIMVQ